MLSQLASRQMLEVLLIAKVAAKLGALVHLYVCLKLTYGLPGDLCVGVAFSALVRERAELDAVADDWVDLSEEISAGRAVRACWCLLA